ncbi:MAG: glycoside hydrolase family 28 protein, partial [Planctomycetes bacterium]|nr:glycoside hydrolase family 28 protein [Planctomycetota bacterium]
MKHCTAKSYRKGLPGGIGKAARSASEGEISVLPRWRFGLPWSGSTSGLVVLLVVLSAASARAETAVPPGAYNVRAFGATADGRTKCTDALARTIGLAAAHGGGTIYFPAGVYLTGPIHLQSHITLYLDAGAVVKFSTDFDDYLPMVASRWEGTEVINFSPLIYARDAEDIALRGRGTLDGQGQAWWDNLGKVKRGDEASRSPWQKEFLRRNAKVVASTHSPALDAGFLRPPFIQPYHCTNVLIEGVTVINSPFWTITPVYCENVTVHAVTIHNPRSPNTDGINPDSCRNVHITDCHISVGDDCITIKSGKDADGRRVGRPAENYTISNCTMADGHGGVVIGSETSGGVRNITISNCVFDGTSRGIRIKSARGRGGVIEDVRVSNIVMRHIQNEAVVITTFYEKSEPEPFSERTPVFRNIRLSGITGDAQVAGELTGLAEKPLEGISLTDVQLDAMTGFTITDAREVGFHQVVLNTDKGPALVADRTEGLELDGLRTSRPHDKTPVVELLNVKNVFVHGCTAAPHTDVFLRVRERA